MLKSSIKVLKQIEKNGYNAYIVGGTVRDIILGNKIKDIDISTNMPMDEIYKTFKRVYDIGKSKDFGIVVVKEDGFDFEVAQFRSNQEKINVKVDFKTDLGHRDVTINAMGIDSNGNIIDHFDGQRDIKEKVIRTVGNPLDRFEEDYLRMMRVCRFASKLDFCIEPKTLKTMKDKRHEIKNIAPERIKDELMKMATQTGDKFAKSIILLDQAGILDIILPEITNLKKFKEEMSHHPEAYTNGDGSVYYHVLSALKVNKIVDPIINLAILIHDIGKATSHEIIDGKNRYFGHAEKSKDLVDNISNRLKLSNKEKDALMFATLNHMKIFNASQMKPTKIVNIVSNEHWPVLKAVFYCDKHCRDGIMDKEKYIDVIDNMEKIYKKYGEKTVNNTLKVVDGNTVMKLTGLKPGKQIGDIIKKVTDIVVNQGSKEKIEDIIMKIYNENL